MKYFIDEEVISKYGLDLPDVLALLLVKCCENVESKLEEMEDREILHRQLDNSFIPTERWNNVLFSILEESDNSLPSEEECTKLAETLREIYPKGMKDGTYAWRGNLREITAKLQKFFVLWGNKYTQEQIIEATKRYVEKYYNTPRQTEMRILKYFILKEHGGEKVSDLATYIENTEEIDQQEWTVRMR